MFSTNYENFRKSFFKSATLSRREEGFSGGSVEEDSLDTEKTRARAKASQARGKLCTEPQERMKSEILGAQCVWLAGEKLLRVRDSEVDNRLSKFSARNFSALLRARL
jgi:hypothetical protein